MKKQNRNVLQHLGLYSFLLHSLSFTHQQHLLGSLVWFSGTFSGTIFELCSFHCAFNMLVWFSPLTNSAVFKAEPTDLILNCDIGRRGCVAGSRGLQPDSRCSRLKIPYLWWCPIAEPPSLSPLPSGQICTPHSQGSEGSPLPRPVRGQISEGGRDTAAVHFLHRMSLIHLREHIKTITPNKKCHWKQSMNFRLKVAFQNEL